MTKTAFIAIVGRPNVGKSTLLNSILGEKVAIVSKKPQTTRNRITGIHTVGEDQFVFLDTPGMHKPRTKLGDFMVKTTNETLGGVDGAILVVEAKEGVGDIEGKATLDANDGRKDKADAGKKSCDDERELGADAAHQTAGNKATEAEKAHGQGEVESKCRIVKAEVGCKGNLEDRPRVNNTGKKHSENACCEDPPALGNVCLLCHIV